LTVRLPFVIAASELRGS